MLFRSHCPCLALVAVVVAAAAAVVGVVLHPMLPFTCFFAVLVAVVVIVVIVVVIVVMVVVVAAVDMVDMVDMVDIVDIVDIVDTDHVVGVRRREDGDRFHGECGAMGCWLVLTNGCGADTSDCITVDNVALGNLNNKELMVYPNPAMDYISINGLGGSFVNYTITDAQGRILKQGKLDNSCKTLDLTQFSTGVYWLNLTDFKSIEIIKQ